MIRALPPFPWQNELWQHFVTQVNDDRFGHATLITGNRGTGLPELAEGMARYLLCVAPLDDLACGQCRSCQLFASQSHPDYRTIFPDEGKQQIRIDQVRDLQAFVGKTSQMQGWKVIVLFPAEVMNENAANALLKNLEEPAGQTAFILISHHPSHVKPTIRSRCAKLDAPLPQPEIALSWLEEQGIERAQVALPQAGGEPLTVIEWSKNGTFLARSELLSALAAYGAAQCSRHQVLQIAAKMDVELTFTSLLSWLEALISAKYTQITPSFLAPLSDALPNLDARRLFAGLDALQKKRSWLLDGYNLNNDLLLDELISDWFDAVFGRKA